jgi:hypothetical protein
MLTVFIDKRVAGSETYKVHFVFLIYRYVFWLKVAVRITGLMKNFKQIQKVIQVLQDLKVSQGFGTRIYVFF